MEAVSDVLSKVVLWNFYYLVPELIVSFALIEVSPGSYMIRVVSWVISEGNLPKMIKLPIVAAFALLIFLLVPPVISAVAGTTLSGLVRGLPFIQMLLLGVSLTMFNLGYTMYMLGASKLNTGLILIFSVSGLSMFGFILDFFGIVA